MSQLILGYPGCGLITWASYADPSKVAWLDVLDLNDPAFSKPEIQVIAAPLTVASFELIATSLRSVWLMYPADNSIGDYYERQNVEKLPEELADRLTITQEKMLDHIREDINVNHRHIILGRNEYAGDYITLQ